MSASSIVQYGPDRTRVRSRIVKPSSGPADICPLQPERAVWRQNPYMPRTLLAALTALALSCPLAAQAQQPSSAEPVVVTTGEGLVQAAPDRAWITIGAESRAQ